MTEGKKSKRTQKNRIGTKLSSFLRGLVSVVISSTRACSSFTGAVLALSGLVYSKIKDFSLLFTSLRVCRACWLPQDRTYHWELITSLSSVSGKDALQTLLWGLPLQHGNTEHIPRFSFSTSHVGKCRPETASVAGVICLSQKQYPQPSFSTLTVQSNYRHVAYRLCL